jgi:hypothetical protein
VTHHNDHADVERRVRTLTAMVEHPSAQCLTAEQYQRITLEVRTCYWLTRGIDTVEWRETHGQVLKLIRRVDLLDPARDPEIHVPSQLCTLPISPRR